MAIYCDICLIKRVKYDFLFIKSSGSLKCECFNRVDVNAPKKNMFDKKNNAYLLQCTLYMMTSIFVRAP